LTVYVILTHEFAPRQSVTTSRYREITSCIAHCCRARGCCKRPFNSPPSVGIWTCTTVLLST